MAHHDGLSGRSPRRGRLLAVCAGATLLVVGSWTLASRIQSPTQAEALAAPPSPTVITAPVELRALSQTLIVRGVVAPAATIALKVPASVTGTVVVSYRPLKPGGNLRDGGLAVEVSGRPVFAIEGTVPSYRTLSAGLIGRDVRQLQAALLRLGCNASKDHDRFGVATARCVAQLYRSHGYQPLGVGGRELSGTDIEGLVVPEGEIVYVPQFPARYNTGDLGSATGAKPGETVPDIGVLTVGALRVRADVSQNDVGLVRSGLPADLLDEATNSHFRGVIETVGALAGPNVDGTTSAPVWISIRTPVPNSLAGATVRVTIVRASSARPGLTVPLSALYTGPSGASYVQVRKAGEQSTKVEVNVGLTADGYAQVVPIQPADLMVDDRVVVGIR